MTVGNVIRKYRKEAGITTDTLLSFKESLSSEEIADFVKKLVDVQNQAAKVFEMGRYNEVSIGLDVVSWEKNVSKTAEIMQDILSAVNHIGDFTQSVLYQHMTFKKMDPDFTKRVYKSLIEGMNDDSYAYMKGNEFWEKNLETGLDSPLGSEDTLSSDSNQTS